MSLGTARVEQAETEEKLAELLEAAGASYFSDATYRYSFAAHLPGINANHSQDGIAFKIFEQVSDQDRDEAIRKKRLSSPDHYRFYFALSGPSHALTQSDVTSMWAAAAVSADQAEKALLRLDGERAAGSLTKADILLERIAGGAYEVLAPKQCKHLLVALSQVMDEAYRRHPFDPGWGNSLWDRAERLVPLCLSRLDSTGRAVVVPAMFGDGSAIGWLTSLFRHETFAHGRHGDSPRQDNKLLLTGTELTMVTELMLNRYRAMSKTDVLSCLHPISFLFAWRQGGDEQGPRHLVESNIGSDEGLVEMLERLTSTIHSSNRGRLEVLAKENLAPFMDFEAVSERIHALKEHSELGARARQLATALDRADGY
jgi:hypothetical protein